MAFGSLAQELLIVLRAKDEASKEVEQARKNIVQAGKDIQNAGKAMSVAVSAPLALLAKTSVDAASSTEESLNKVRVVFGQGAKAIEEFSATAATSLGISRQGALEAAGTFGNLFVAMGFGGREAATMSTRLLTLASDLASFNNMDPTEVLEKLRSGLVGQTEPLRTVGVNLNQARIEAEAFALGIVKPVQNEAEIRKAYLSVADATRDVAVATKQYGTSSFEAQKARNALELAEQSLAKAVSGSVPELNAAQKAQAAYSIILKDTAKAHGDFKNTSDGLANSTRIAKAQFADLQAELGQELVPVMKEVVVLVKDVLTGFRGMDPEMRRAVVLVGAVAFAIGPLLIVLGSLITVAPAVAAAVMLMFGPFGVAAIAVGGAVFLIIRHWDDLKRSAEQLANWFRSLGQKDFVEIGADIVNGLWRGISDHWYRIIPGGVGYLVKGLVDMVKDALGARSPAEIMIDPGYSVPQGLNEGMKRGLPELLQGARELGMSIGTGVATGIEEGRVHMEVALRNSLHEAKQELARMAKDLAEAAQRAKIEAAERARDIARSPLPFAQQPGVEGRGGVWADPVKDPALWRAQMIMVGLDPDSRREVNGGVFFDPFDPLKRTRADTVTILPNRHQGGPIHRTGPYVLEKGEHVVERGKAPGGIQVGPFIINGTVVDLEALGDVVRDAVAEGKRRGGFHGVMPEAA